jgi:hypothetical protein
MAGFIRSHKSSSYRGNILSQVKSDCLSSSAKLAWSVAGLTFEYSAEILLVFKAAAIADLFDAKRCAAQKLAGCADLEMQTVLMRADSSMFAKRPPNVE